MQRLNEHILFAYILYIVKEDDEAKLFDHSTGEGVYGGHLWIGTSHAE